MRLHNFGFGIALGGFLLLPFTDIKYVVGALLMACFCCLYDIADKENK